MTDREMLELAARAAGLSFKWRDGDPKWGPEHVGPAAWINECWQAWNPLTDDGDALRLSVRLRMDVQHFEGLEMCEACKHPYQACGEDYGCDPDAATRRAITRAAAEIGKSMEGKA